VLNTVSVPYVFQDQTTFLAEYVNADFTALTSAINQIIAALNAQTSTAGYPTFLNAAAAPYGMAVANTPTANTAALQAAVSAAIAAGGGIVFIPAGIYNMSPSVVISGLTTGGIVIQGSSAGTQLVAQGSGDMFQVNNNNGVYGGTRFRDISFQYPKGSTSGIAINVNSSGENTTAEFCLFTNCPQAMKLGALYSGMFACRVFQGNLNNSTQVTISQAECFISQCILYQQPISSSGPTGCIGVQINSGSDKAWITNSHISDFNQGIVIAAGSFIYIIGSSVAAWTNGVYIVSNSVNAVFMVANQISQSLSSTAQSSGVYIDSNGGPSTNVASIYGDGNVIYGWANAGLQVNVAQDIVFNGGQISSNGLNPSSTPVGANVAITAAAVRVKLNGIDMSGVFSFNGGQSPYALAVSGSGGCIANSCDVSGCATGTLYTSSPGTLKLFNCQGYNGLLNLISNATPANATQTNLAGLGFYGPGTMYVTGGTVSAVKLGGTSMIAGNAAGPVSGAFPIPDPYTYFQIDWSGSPSVTFFGS
jgi:hypothetical protein